MPSEGPPSGSAGAGPNGRTMTPAVTATMATDLGVTPTGLTAAITKARATGAGVNLVKTRSSELNLPEATVEAAPETWRSQRLVPGDNSGLPSQTRNSSAWSVAQTPKSIAGRPRTRETVSVAGELPFAASSRNCSTASVSSAGMNRDS